MFSKEADPETEFSVWKVYEGLFLRSTPVDRRGEKQEWAGGEVKLGWRSNNDLDYPHGESGS